MIISKKKFEEKLCEARLSEIERADAKRAEYENSRWIDERITTMSSRIDTAFADIDRRLSALESKPRGDVFPHGRY